MDIIAVALGYFIGSVPFALILTRYAGVSDLRLVGSGNIGATNVFRIGNKLLSACVLILDISKGFVTVLVARSLEVSGDIVVMAAVGSVVGHVFPVWLKFRGGKGVATSCGVFLLLTPLASALAIGVFVIVVFVTRFVSLASILAMLTLSIVVGVNESLGLVFYTTVSLSLLVIARHHQNIARLHSGNERRINEPI
tara:strand:+ start:536 stop:1123 length:588 start_codon:yes stop_codon:yes gene_type:complete